MESDDEPPALPSLSADAEGLATSANAASVDGSDHERENSASKIQAGNVGTFLLQALSSGMSNERLVGPIPAPPPSGMAVHGTLNQDGLEEKTSDHTPTQNQLEPS